MFKRTKVCSAAVLALGGGALLASSAFAQPTQRIEITGSAIKRVDAEGALPVQVLRREDIARSGATSTTDLLQRLPAIQGGFSESSSVGSGGGFTGVSIHNIGETRTLVLLNGRRLAQWGGQSLTGFGAAVDLNAIPVSAIERIEILTDGASALYGADAIAGVVNFITRRDSTDGDVTIGISSPKGGARELRASATIGIGSLAKDNFNVLLSLSHDERTKLDAKSRNFGSTGKVFFTHEGKSYRKQQFSASPIPANALNNNDELISPYRLKNGSCPDKTFRVIEPYNDGTGLVDDYCGFDFVGELEIYPVRERDSLTLSATTRLASQELFVEARASQTKSPSRIAPVRGAISFPAGPPLPDKYLKPLGITVDSLAFYRLFDLGKRESKDVNKFIDVAVGARGVLAGWDYYAALSHSESESKTNISGYPGALAVRSLRASGLLDPFIGPGQQSAAAQTAINGASYNGYWDGGTSQLDALQLRGSRDLMQMGGGAMQLGLGLSVQQEKFQSKPSLFAQGKLANPVLGTLCNPTATPAVPCDQRFGDEASTVPYSADRNAYGLFAELVTPITKGFELTTSLRHDNYSDFGNATTAKLGARLVLSKEVLIRGSVGTGFHAPTVPQVNAAIQPFGVTNNKYLCSVGLLQIATSLGAVCQTGNRQYDQIAGGNKDLLPEKSKQATFGVVFEPMPQVSLGATVWHVAISDAFGQLTEEQVFGNPLQYRTSWGTKKDTGTGVTYVAFVADNRNLGKSTATGLDLDISARTKLGFGDLTSKLDVTYMINEKSQLEINGPYYSAIGNFAELGSVTFRWQGKLTNTLKMGAWAHTLVANFKSGYLDQATGADVLDGSGNVTASETIRLRVKKYATLDWQTSWAPIKSVLLTVGAVNVLDTKPPLAISTGGGNRGQQFGFDDRYYDSRGRQVYGNVSYRF